MTFDFGPIKISDLASFHSAVRAIIVYYNFHDASHSEGKAMRPNSLTDLTTTILFHRYIELITTTVN